MPQRTDDLVPRILPVGDAAVLVEFGDSIDPAINDRVYSFAESVTAADIEGVEELVPTYRSLLVQYDLHKVAYEDVAARLEEFAKVAESPADTVPAGMWSCTYRWRTAANSDLTWRRWRTTTGFLPKR